MSTRRSRIQIKPNLGRKSDGPAGSGQRKPTPAAPAAATSGAGDSAAVGTTTIAAAAAPHEPSAADQPDVASVPEQPATVPVVEEPTKTAAAPPEETPCASDAVAETPAETPHVAEPTRAEPAVTKSPIKRPAPVIPACASPEKVARPSETSEPLTPPRSRQLHQVHRRSRRLAKGKSRCGVAAGAPPPRKPPTDRSAMTMQDLIYYNPPGKPMPEKPSKTSKDKAPVETESVAEAEEQRVDDVVEQEEDSADVGPRVRLGPNGEITLDEESLVIRRPAVQPSMRAIVYETGGETNYASFRKNPKGRSTWTAKQTAQFYKALSACGTDFTLMANFFPKRTRQELKNKFKREERRNRELIDRTINDPTQYYIDDLKLESDDPDEPERAQPAPKRGRGRKRKAPPTEDGGVREEVVEEEVVHEEIILPEEPETEQTTDETTGPATVGGSSAVTMGPCVSGGVAPVVGGPTPPLRLQAGQLVFYASRTQEQVVHVFVVAPPQAGASSELAARLSSPPLQRPAATASPSAAS
ncbi:hypothetical protein MRX96_054773 [Rhipicephalus microplus]